MFQKCNHYLVFLALLLCFNFSTFAQDLSNCKIVNVTCSLNLKSNYQLSAIAYLQLENICKYVDLSLNYYIEGEKDTVCIQLDVLKALGYKTYKGIYFTVNCANILDDKNYVFFWVANLSSSKIKSVEKSIKTGKLNVSSLSHKKIQVYSIDYSIVGSNPLEKGSIIVSEVSEILKISSDKNEPKKNHSLIDKSALNKSDSTKTKFNVLDSILLVNLIENKNELNNKFDVSKKRFEIENKQKTPKLDKDFQKQINKSINQFNKYFSYKSTLKNIPDSIKSKCITMKNFLDTLEIESLGKHDKEYLFQFTKTYNQILQTYYQNRNDTLIFQNLYYLMADFEDMIDIIKQYGSESSSIISDYTNEIFSCSSDPFFNNDFIISENSNSTKYIPVLIGLKDGNGKDVENIEVYCVLRGLSYSLENNFFSNSSEHRTISPQYLLKKRYKVFFIDSKSLHQLQITDITIIFNYL
jgi:hypothetical protein